MSGRRNFSMDDETDALLEEHPEDNHSDIVRELLKEYYTAGVYDTEQAARKVKVRKLRERVDELDNERERLERQLEQIEATTEESGETSIESVASELTIPPERVSVDNPAIQQKAEKNGIDPSVLADVVKEQAVEQRQNEYKSVSDD